MSNTLRVLFVAALFTALSPFTLAQNRTAAPNPSVDRAIPSSVEVLSERGGADVFTTRAAFTSACGTNLSTETFQEANIAAGGFDVVGAPLPPEDGVIFPAGSIEDGLEITVTTVSGLGDDLFVSGQGFGGAPSVQVGNNQNTDDLFANFSPAVDCAGYDVDLNNTGTATTIEARDASGNVLGSATVSGFNLQFVGFKSTGARIASVVALASVSVEFVDIDNVSFGNMGVSAPISITAGPAAQSVARGGRASFTYMVTNNLPGPVSGVVFYEVFRGPSRVVGPVQVQSGTVPANSSTPQLTFGVNVPNSAPVGTYRVAISAGPNNGATIATASVNVTVTAARVAGSATTWSLADAQPWPTLEAAARTSETGAYPNPFARSTEIGFSLEQAAKVSLTVYDVRGREVAVLADGTMEAGQHSVTFDAASLPSGVYVYRLTTGTQVETGRITLVK